MDVSFSALRLTCPPIPPSPRFTPGRSRRLRGPPVGAFPGGFPGGTCFFGRGAATRWWNPPPPRRIGDRGIHEPQLLCFAAVGNSTRELRSSVEETDRLTIDEDCREADNKTKDRKLHPDNSDGEKMVKVCDKLIEVFMVDKPRTTDWRNLLAFSREWSNIRPHFFRRCQERADAAEDPEMKHKLHRLGRKLKEIDEDVQRHNELLGVVKAAPSEISKIVSRRRKDFTKEFFMHLHAVAESYYENPAEQNALVGLRNACLAALEAYDAVSESIEALNFAELKFQDIINSPSLDVARKKIDSLAEKKELDSALMLMMTKAWAGAKDSTMMKDEAKDILYHLYLTGTANLQRLVPKDIRILKYLLKVEDPEEQLCALRDAFTPGVELEGEDIDTLCTTPEKLFTWIITVLNAYHFGGEGTLIREARDLMNPKVIQRLEELKKLVQDNFL